ncbi:hypothetical protein FHW12_000340 [Dokdonella fugitiva]|uniref:Uncharacterized protein n=1 Tax=Dokdonella fugitiva TaxID=328517 RepID=A0A839EWQ9_9GAMM|nr:hypothetical protein [Dokdonella fugitiva]MBA8886149.1 hypothetical protein [Dokdonella fugitiva]
MTKRKSTPGKKRRLSNGASTAPETIACRERNAKALQLRKEGMNFEDIARECGFTSRQRAHEAVTAEIKRITREPAEDVLVLELERLDAMFTTPYLNAQAGDLNAINACLRIMDRRAALLGIDAPKKVEAKVEQRGGVLMVPAAVTPEEWAKAAEAQQRALAESEKDSELPDA